jgi:hypothetical protein
MGIFSERGNLDYAWRRAVIAYQRAQGFEALRDYLRETMPPQPPELVVSPETLAWFGRHQQPTAARSSRPVWERSKACTGNNQ